MKKLDLNQEPKTQSQLVNNALKQRAVSRMTEITETVPVLGVETLHLKTYAEIAEVLANVLKSRSGVKAITYTVGKSIQITSESDHAVDP